MTLFNSQLGKRILKLGLVLGGAIFALLMWVVIASQAQAATFSITPEEGTYSVGSTFDVTVILDTKGQSINALQMQLSFPPDKLQLVSPQVGNSIIEIYTTPPRYDNSRGTVDIVGGIPNGINVNSGLVAKLTFRVRSLGSAALRFTGESQALLNDGRGTNVLNNTSGANLTLELPPSQGPIVLSDSHPDQERWYRDNNVRLRWDDGLPPAEGYSYTISDNATDVPDDVPESANTFIDYRSVPDGINYFHIKALRDGRWGGVTRYTLRIDTAAPSDFKIKISPNVVTFVTQPLIQFGTSDGLSGFDRYEIKIVPLKIEGREQAVGDGLLFTEAQSPYQTPELLYGTYEIIVRAYDKAGNIRDVTQRLEITDAWLWFIGSGGITLISGKLVPWSIVFPILIGLLILLLILAYLVYRWYKHHHKLVTDYQHPQSVEEKLAELRYYRQKYGKVASVILLGAILSASVLFSGFGSGQNAIAAEITPPTLETYSQFIKDDELFYVAGRTVEPNTDVVVHLQNMVDGQAFDFSTISDKRGDWIYRHNSFLPGGKYIVWAHSKSGQELSVPSPQVEIDVKPVAINWGGSRITYQSIYVTAIAVLTVTVILLAIFIVVGLVLARRRRHQFATTVRMAEEGLRHGFMAIKRDLEAELALLQRATAGGEFAGEANVRAEQLRQDLKNIEELAGRETAEMERFAGLPRRID
jgi:lipopolysaccharide export system protein LptC